MKAAYKEANGIRLNERRILVDCERGRTVQGWKPKKLGGGLGKIRFGPQKRPRSQLMSSTIHKASSSVNNNRNGPKTDRSISSAKGPRNERDSGRLSHERDSAIRDDDRRYRDPRNQGRDRPREERREGTRGDYREGSRDYRDHRSSRRDDYRDQRYYHLIVGGIDHSLKK
jgi:U1 small nuclear ribonucleoprotein 70kDa